MQWHHFTVDVEEYFQVSAFEGIVPRFQWSSLESRVAAPIDRLLDLLARSDSHGTFFVVGWLAQRQPAIVRTIAAAGHEIASHTWNHVRVTEQSPEEFRASVRRCRYVLEDISGTPVHGFRAPSFSIVPGTEWALDVLLEEGYRYDSSLFPIRRPGYGFPGGKRDVHWLSRPAGRLLEVPPATVRWAGVNLPAGGGAYFRLFPYAMTRAALHGAARRGHPGTFYIHPWEIDPGQPRLPVGRLGTLRHYGGLTQTYDRICTLLREFHFEPITATLERVSEFSHGASGQHSPGTAPVSAKGA